MATRKSFSLLRAVGELSLWSSCILSRTGSQYHHIHNGGILSATRLPLSVPCRNKSKKSELYSSEEKRMAENNYVYPPQSPSEPRRPGEICHFKKNIKYSQKKLWYIAAMIRGLSIDEAVKQLTFSPHKGAYVIKKILLDLQQEAVDTHVCEYKSNLWVESSQAEDGEINAKIRQLYRGRYIRPAGRLQFVNYFVRLREGKPPKHYYPPPQTGYEKMEEYIKRQRSRTIQHSL